MLLRTLHRNIFTAINIRLKSSNYERADDIPYNKVNGERQNLSQKGLAIAFDSEVNSDVNNRTTLPGQNNQLLRRDQALKAFRPENYPDEPTIILFPGQGSQFVGMATSLVDNREAKDMFSYASEILKYDLLKLCNEGPDGKLNQTKYCQPAVMVTSLAALELLKQQNPNAIENCIGTAGFSLGEITSLVFAGALPFDKAVYLVKIRAEAMQAASEINKGGMATIMFEADSKLSLACEKAKEWCIERGVENPDCIIANYLFPHCKVVAGSEEALKYIEENLATFKLTRMKRIPAYGAFHTSLMSSAVQPFADALQRIQIEEPIISVYSNVNGRRYMSPTHILKQLPQQIIRPVKWEQTMHILYERKSGAKFPQTYVCGPGTALKTILKQVNAKAWESTTKVGD